MAVTLIGGTLGGTVVTLVFLPAVYALLFRIKQPGGKAAPDTAVLAPVPAS